MATETSTTLPAGYMLQDFEVESILGVGGFGITYRARDIHLNRHVAIKEYMPVGLATRGRDAVTVMPATEGHKDDFNWGFDRFRMEAETLVAFRHPNIVTVFRYFPANGTAYLVMEYQDGKTLGELIHPDRTLTEDEILEIIFPLLDGLEQVHNASFMHRDIKPANIFIRNDGKPVLIDFGAARQAVAGHSQGLTSIVTAGYAPYEQYDSETEQGPWTDIYAIGATLYRCVAGERPVEAPRRAGAVMRNKDDPMKPAAAVAKGKYSAGLLDAIDTSMAVLEQDRPQSVAALRDLLRGAQTAATLSGNETMIAGGVAAAGATAVDAAPAMAARTAAAVGDQKKSGGAGKWIAIGIAALVVVGGGGGAAVVLMNQEKGTDGPVTNADEKAWQDAQTLNTLSGYRDFIAKFPNSRRVDDARQAIRTIEAKNNQNNQNKLAKADNDAFARAKAANTAAAYQAYLDGFPNGRHRAEAAQRLAALTAPKHPADMAKPIKNPYGSLAARYAHVFGYWCSKKFEMNLTRTHFMTRNREAAKGLSYAITRIDFQQEYFRVYYLDKKTSKEIAYEFVYNPKQRNQIHLRRLFYQGNWRNVNSTYSRKC